MKTFIFFVGALISSFAFSFAGGSGTSADPYQIGTIADLQAVNTDLTACYILLNDIDMSGTTYSEAIIANVYGNRFTGTLDGGGHIISGLTINNLHEEDWGDPYSDPVANTGLIGETYEGAYIHDLGIAGCNISATGSQYTGALIGYNVYGTVTNCYSTGTISSPRYSGGLFGGNHGAITGCWSQCNIGSNCCGGIAGSCYVASALSQCYATGSVSGTGECGGLVGSNQGAITNCFATGNATGGAWGTGGLVGARVKGDILNCYSTGAVSGTDYVGGLIGRYYTSFTSSVTNSYWDTETSGTAASGGGTGLTTAQMQTQGSFTGWDFSGVWQMAGYPVFVWAYVPPSYTVAFNAGAHGAITAGEALQLVVEGSAAAAPEITADTGWVFTGWDSDFSNVTGDITVTALYGATVPDVVGLSGREGWDMLGDSGFTKAVLYAEDGGAPKGTITSQSPQAGAVVEEPGETTVEITISMGPRCNGILMADLNGDCIVNITDLAAMADVWLFDES